jgi:hypothetical protein
MSTVSFFITPAILFLLTLGFGFWLSATGKPYNGLLFNVHKLIALAAVILTAIRFYNPLNGAETQALLIVVIALAGVCVVALFVTGALMSIGNPAYSLLRTIHRIAMAVAALAMAATGYLLTWGNL